jgi:hypothetical protein
MDERLRFVSRLLGWAAMSATCRGFGISRKTGHRSRPSRISALISFLVFACSVHTAAASSFPPITSPAPQPDEPDQLFGTPRYISGQGPQVKYTVVDREVGIFLYYGLDQLCRADRFRLSVQAPPRHGNVKFVQAVLASAEAKESLFSPGKGLLSRCKSPDLTAREVIYVPDEGFVGRDSVAIGIFDFGHVTTMRYDIVVRSGREPY